MNSSRFLPACQNARTLPTTCDSNHRFNVRVTDLATPIVVSYRLPLLIWALTAAGLAAGLICAIPALWPTGGWNKDRPAAASG